MIRRIKERLDRILQHSPLLMWAKLYVKFHWKLKRKLQRQLRVVDDSGSDSFGRKSKRILLPMIETTHYQYLQMLILAKALQLRGAEVSVLLCGSRLDGCEIKSVKNTAKDPCLTCRFNHDHVVPLYGLNVIQLSDFVSDEEVKSLRKEASILAADYPAHFFHKGIDIIPMTNDSIMRHYYGGIPPDFDLLKTTREQHLTSSMIGVEVAERIDKIFSPDVILNNMNVYSAWEPYYKYFGKRDRAELATVSISPFNYHAVVLNSMELYMSTKRYQKFIESRACQRLTDKEKAALQGFVDSRVKGKTLIFQELGFFEADKQVVEHISIDKTKRNIFVFPNIYWDVGLGESGQLFDDVITWVWQTIEIVKDWDECHLYVKIHPAEKYDTSTSLKGIKDFIYERYPVLPHNVTVITPELKISPYDLFPFIDLGVVFNGTLGMEMLLHNIPVAITGKAPYGKLNFAHEPVTMEDYGNILLGVVPSLSPKKDEVELFAYFYFIKSLIPWKLNERAYADNFKGYEIESLEDIKPGEDRYLDHICNCILDSKNTVFEGL